MGSGQADRETRAADAEHRHGTDLTLRCNQCGTSWEFGVGCAVQCSDCLDHLGELIDPEHPEWCQRDHGCVLRAGHEGRCDLTGPICECARCASFADDLPVGVLGSREDQEGQ